jgi:hypothetical protein
MVVSLPFVIMTGFVIGVMVIIFMLIKDYKESKED